MKVAVIGIGGVGTVIAKELAKSDTFEKIILGDIDEQRVRQLTDEVGDPRFEPRRLDASDSPQVKAFLQGVDLVINATIPRFNLIIMDAALDARCHYMDMASDGPVKLPGRVDVFSQMEYDQKFKDVERTAILCLGADPGATNIFARYAADTLDEVEAILIRDGDNSVVEGYNFALYFSPDTNIEECLQPPLVFEDGHFVYKEPLVTGVEVFNFPDPIGPRKTYAVSHEEVGTIPLHIKKGLKHCDFKYALSDEFVSLLHSLRLVGLHRIDEVTVKGVRVVPRDVVTALLPEPRDLGGKIKGDALVGTLVKGRRGEAKVEMFLYNVTNHEESYRKMGVNATVLQTGIPPVVAAELLAHGEITTPGVLLPECLDPKPFMDILPERGWPIVIEEKVTTITRLG
ncbi:MAG TPA: saccharopine dehydrogenase-like oxidoreductase [Clostridia bacterium]|nr:saccharopine dehydrogenase-like oxidoreductase [Clostridia bacterium]